MKRAKIGHFRFIAFYEENWGSCEVSLSHMDAHHLPLAAAATALSLLSPAMAQKFPDLPAEHVSVQDFVTDEDLEVTLWAASPELYNPTNMDVDQHGRIWVTEGVNYRWKKSRPEGDRIMVLEDTDGDGKADQSSVFLQDQELKCPLGIAVFDNRVVISQPPHLLIYTDVDRDLVFNPKTDRREVLLTGFNAAQHDHSLHSVTAGPDGKWYFNGGNCGAVFTDQSGKTFYLGGPYYKSGGGEWPVDTLSAAGKVSDDGYIWASGFTVRMNPDGTEAEIIGQGYRNSYENINDSFGNLFQSDNDDPPACRNSYVLEYGSAGYFTEDAKRFYYQEWRNGMAHGLMHWRQGDPDTFDAGDIYGGGSPTGVAIYENGALPDRYIGTYFACEPGKNRVFSYQPKAKGASFEMKRHDFLDSNPEGNFLGADFSKLGVDAGAGGKKMVIGVEQPELSQGKVDPRLFRPSDVMVGPDGALYVADWFDGRVGGHATLDESASGAIYRIAPKGFQPKIPQFDLASTEGAVKALRSPANNVRWLGFMALKKKGAEALPAVKKLLSDPNQWIAARAIWLLPHLGAEGLQEAEGLLRHENWERRLVALRSLRRVTADPAKYARRLQTDPSEAVRRDVALSLRHSPESTAVPILLELARRVDISDKNAVLALRIGAGKKRSAFWKAIREDVPREPANWPAWMVRLTWSLGVGEAVPDLVARATDQSLGREERLFAVESLAFVDDRRAAVAMARLAEGDSEMRRPAESWFGRRAFGAWEKFELLEEMERLGLYDPNAPAPVPMEVPPAPEPSFAVPEVLALSGSAEAGQTTALRCVMCHKIGEHGIPYGPDLKGWAKRQTPEAFVQALIDPSADIAHGFEGAAVELKSGGEIHGRLERWDNPTIIKATGAQRQIIPPKSVKKVRPMKRSLMLSADQLGLTAQDVADLLAWFQTY